MSGTLEITADSQWANENWSSDIVVQIQSPGEDRSPALVCSKRKTQTKLRKEEAFQRWYWGFCSFVLKKTALLEKFPRRNLWAIFSLSQKYKDITDVPIIPVNLINHIAPALLVPLVTNLSMTGIDAMDERSVSFKGKCCYNSDFLSLLTDCKKWNEVWYVSCPSKIWIDLGSSRRNIMNVSLGAISNWNILPSNINHCQSD